MVTTTWGRSSSPLSTGQVLTALGAVTAGFSLVAGLLFLFVFPAACSFLGGLGIIALAGLFIVGMILFAIGRILLHRQKSRSVLS